MESNKLHTQPETELHPDEEVNKEESYEVVQNSDKSNFIDDKTEVTQNADTGDEGNF